MSRSDVDSLKIFAGRYAIDLAQRICGHLDLPLGAARTEAFPDGELIEGVDGSYDAVVAKLPKRERPTG